MFLLLAVITSSLVAADPSTSSLTIILQGSSTKIVKFGLVKGSLVEGRFTPTQFNSLTNVEVLPEKTNKVSYNLLEGEMVGVQQVGVKNLRGVFPDQTVHDACQAASSRIAIIAFVLPGNSTQGYTAARVKQLQPIVGERAERYDKAQVALAQVAKYYTVFDTTSKP